MGEWLDQWLLAKKSRKTTLNGYASHIRVHLKPRIGHVRLDRLNVGHLVEMYDGIADANEVIQAENLERREQIARCKPSKPGRPIAAERARLAVEREKLAEMKPFRKITGPATQQSIRRTLRAALNAAIAQQYITFNPASHVELESGKRPKPLLWTTQRVERWRATSELPSPVMVWTRHSSERSWTQPNPTGSTCSSTSWVPAVFAGARRLARTGPMSTWTPAL